MTDDKLSVQRTTGVQPESVWHLELPDVRFGLNAVEELPYLLETLGVDETAKGLVVTDETLAGLGHLDRVRSVLEGANVTVDVYDDVERDPSIGAFRDCIKVVREHGGDGGYDFYVGLGGGSCMDTAKIASAIPVNGGDVLDYVVEPSGGGEQLRTAGPPLVLIPTTAGTGSEVTAAAAVTLDGGVKDAILSPHTRADAAILDPGLTTTLPADLTAETAMDALGHAIEAYTTPRYDQRLREPDPLARPSRIGRSETTDVLVEKAIRLLVRSLRRAVNNPEDVEARADLLLGSMLARFAGNTAGANLCHAMAYPVASEYHTHHGETIAALAPASTLGYNVASEPERFARVAEFLGVDASNTGAREAADRARGAFVQLQRDLGVLPSGLYELAGVTEDDVGPLAKRVVESQHRLLASNPRRVTEDALREVFRDALYNW
ncbi:MAG: hydroxyacid-oxoacid transhydrogenase [Halobacteriota archaeon]